MNNTMEIKANLLKSLTVPELREIIDVFGIECDTTARKTQLIEAVLGSSVRVCDIAENWSEVRLKEFCEQIGMDPLGRKNALLKKLADFLNEPATPETSTPTAVSPNSPSVLTEIRTDLIRSLTVQELREIIKGFDIQCDPTSKKNLLAEAVLQSPVGVCDIAVGWSEAQVKEFCEEIGMDPHGRKNVLLKKLAVFLNESVEHEAFAVVEEHKSEPPPEKSKADCHENPAQTKADLISMLPVQELRKIVKDYGIDIAESSKKNVLIEAILKSPVGVCDIVGDWDESELKGLCEAIGMNSIGRKNALLKKLAVFLNEPAERLEKKRPELPPENHQELVELESVINQLIMLGKILIGKINRGFCGACNKMHAKQWFDFADHEVSFYICRIGTPTVVMRTGDQYENLSASAFILKYKTSGTEQRTYEVLLQKYVESEIHNDPDLKALVAAGGGIEKMALKFVDLTSAQSRSSGAATTFFASNLGKVGQFTVQFVNQTAKSSSELLKNEKVKLLLDVLEMVPGLDAGIKVVKLAGFVGGIVAKKMEVPQEEIKVLPKPKDFTEISSKFVRITVTLSWTHAIDLDLYALYHTKDGKIGEIYHESRGSLKTFPFMKLDEDAGIGNVGGNNEENLHIASLAEIDYVLIAVNIYQGQGFFSLFKKKDSFSRYDGKILIQPDDKQYFEIPLSSAESGNWCVVAGIENRKDTLKILNINSATAKKPDLKHWQWP